MEETNCSLNCCGYRRKYKVCLFYLSGIDHMALSYDVESVRVSEVRPTWRTIAYHWCSKGEELKDIVCQS